MTREDVVRITEHLKTFLERGYGISIARKKALGFGANTKAYRTLVLQPEYIAVLNDYLDKRNCGYSFKREGIRLVKVGKAKAP